MQYGMCSYTIILWQRINLYQISHIYKTTTLTTTRHSCAKQILWLKYWTCETSGKYVYSICRNMLASLVRWIGGTCMPDINIGYKWNVCCSCFYTVMMCHSVDCICWFMYVEVLQTLCMLWCYKHCVCCGVTNIVYVVVLQTLCMCWWYKHHVCVG